jgi:hypothetical protein
MVTRRTQWTSRWRRSALSKRKMIRSKTVKRRRKKNLRNLKSLEESIDHVLFEWSSILGLGMGEADANDDERLEVVEKGQVRPLWPIENVPNWPQEPTLAKLTGLRGTKVLLGVLFKGVDLPNSY